MVEMRVRFNTCTVCPPTLTITASTKAYTSCIFDREMDTNRSFPFTLAGTVPTFTTP
jgi:hypothetical protein